MVNISRISGILRCKMISNTNHGLTVVSEITKWGQSATWLQCPITYFKNSEIVNCPTKVFRMLCEAHIGIFALLFNKSRHFQWSKLPWMYQILVPNILWLFPYFDSPFSNQKIHHISTIGVGISFFPGNVQVISATSCLQNRQRLSSFWFDWTSNRCRAVIQVSLEQVKENFCKAVTYY